MSPAVCWTSAASVNRPPASAQVSRARSNAMTAPSASSCAPVTSAPSTRRLRAPRRGCTKNRSPERPISIVPGNWQATIGAESDWISANPVNLANWLISAMFMIDVTFATVGYVLTLKPLDAHIRTANPHAAGWAAALICYPPFILMNPGGPLDYHVGNGEWTYWLADYPLAMDLMGLWLVFLTGLYAWATVAFGILVPMFGLGVVGSWAARYGRFPPRETLAPKRRRASGGGRAR